ncbi:hypothetical protein KOW79_021772 [Hemibagrus wyckioides]|uniref:Uncharacterized protein n=1 Tax=Hemibagrus wyckioides TaxID=337641 RepID=A0A9D3N1U4_9TELE|nr:hypothetical protein KOW79_021772 [Hemibagrus wyckioides]
MATSRSDGHSRVEENSISKTVSMLSSEMAELKCLLHPLQPVTGATPVKTTQDDENAQNQGAGEDLLNLLISLTWMCFLHVLLIPFCLIMGKLWMWLCNPHHRMFSLVTQQQRGLVKGSGLPKWHSKIARTLATMAEADSIGMGRAPEIEQPVAALVVSPDEALRGNVRCPSAQCGRTDSLLKKAYESVAYIARTENKICQLLLAATSTLEPANVDPSISQFLQTALLAMGHVTRELGNLTATLLAARRQVCLAQARLPEDCKKTL